MSCGAAGEGAGRVLRLGIVTLGGERRAIMVEQFAQLSQQCAGKMQLDVTYLDGVKGAALAQKPALTNAAALLIDVCRKVGKSYVLSCIYIYALHHA